MLADEIKEVIFIGMPGPTHNYGGLSGDNVASRSNQGSASSPKTAARQALELVRTLKSLGVVTAILPPQLRPSLSLLRQHYMGDDEELIRQVAAENPALLEKASSSSAMWVANAATTTPASDAGDGLLHLTTANLFTNLHRRIEAADTHKVLTQIFAHVPDAVIHAPLPQNLPDEGDANHMRLAPRHGEKGLHILVYGTDGTPDDPKTARQSKAASEALAQHHAIPDNQVLLLKQNPELIKQGVFHNDVIGVSNETVLLVHEEAFSGGHADIKKIEAAYAALHAGKKLCSIVIRASDLSVEEAVRTYLFNSQIVTKPDGNMAIIAPSELQTLYNGKAAKLVDAICADVSNPINEARYLDLRQSMRNGGGPACLRLRVPMFGAQIEAMKKHVNVLVDDALIASLERIIEAYYPEQLTPQDVKEPRLYELCKSMLTALSTVMRIRLI